MKNFGRAIRLCLQYRFSVFASIFLAVGVGVLWGANIGAALPVIEVVLGSQSLQDWVDERIDEAEKTSRERWLSRDALHKELAAAPPNEQPALRNKIAQAEDRIDAENEAAARYRRLKPYITRYLPETPFQTLVLLIGVLLVGTIVKSIFLIGHQIVVARISHSGVFELRNLFFRRTLRMDVTTFSREGISDLMSRFTHDMNNVAVGLNTVFGKLVREPLKMVACLIGAAVICWRLLILSLVIAPLAGLLIRWLARTLKRANRRAMEEMARVYANLEEAFRGIRVVKAFTMERRERIRFHTNTQKYYKNAMRIARYNALAHPMTETLGMLTVGLAILGGAYLVLTGDVYLFGIQMNDRPLSLPKLLAFFGFLIGTADPARKLSDLFTRLQAAAAASDRIYAMLDRVARIRDPERPRPLRRHCRDLEFEQVDFAYQAERPVLQDVNLRIAFGETVAIVGPSGCGKSTLANLIPRFADPDAGEIRLDGIPLDQLRLRRLRRQIGMVSQEPLLFNDTVANNIRYGSPHATLDQVVQAAKQAHAHPFIERDLADGYQTMVGPMGGQLSGGQRQRICLARAILRNPPILILDEATSQIDLESEQIIQRVLEQFINGRTVIMITHRLASLALADRIVVMDEGRILDAGTHRELLDRCQLYSRLHQIQFEDLRKSA